MRINFTKLIKESADKPAKTMLAKEMAEAGLFKNKRTAEITIQNIEQGRAKSIKWDLLKFLIKRFEIKGSEIIEWD